MKRSFLLMILLYSTFSILCSAQDGLIPEFKLEPNDLELHRLARPGTPFDKVGHKFAILGDESGAFEVWAYPLKLFRNLQISFFIGTSTQAISGCDIVRYISVTPEATTLTYTYQSFTVKATYITPVDEPGAMILLKVDSSEPLVINFSFSPVLQPMWPAGIGGQYAYWDNNNHYYLMSEPTRQNHGVIGSPLAEKVSYTPAHMLSDTPNEFKINITEPDSVQGKYIPVIMAGGKGDRKEVLATYKRLCANPQLYYEKNLQYYRKLREKTVQINTPNKKLNLAFEWGKVSFDNLIVDNPDLGKGMVAGLGASGNSGRPGFGWFFGGDSFMNIYSINSYGDYSTAQDVLAFNRKWQRKDGKMAHELSQAAAYIDWWKDYPYGFIHGDTTPHYIAAMFDYYKMTGDISFIRESWESLKKAWDWCLRTDVNGDGLMDNKKAGLASVEYGEFTNVETDIYLAAVWVRAAYGMKEMAEAVGKNSFAKKIDAVYQRAVKSFDENLWNPERQIYSYAFNKDGEHVEEISPYLALGMLWNCGSPERTAKSLEKLNAADITTDWGVRIFSSTSKYFKPLGYNYGCVWPFITMYASSALFRHEFALQGYNLLMATVNHTFDNNLGHVTELYSGGTNIWPEEAVSHQGFSAAGVLMPTVRGLCGLEGNAVDKVLNFEPHFPADWENVDIKNYCIGKAEFNIRYHRTKNTVSIEINTEKSAGYGLNLAPAFGIGTKIKEVTINGTPVNYDIKESWQMIQPIVKYQMSGATVVCEIEIEPTVELLSPKIDFGTGERNRGLKILSVRYKERKITVKAEGLAGENYLLHVVNPDKITGVTGGVLEKDVIKISIAKGEYGKFTPHILTIDTK